jgi:hemerythrin
MSQRRDQSRPGADDASRAADETARAVSPLSLSAEELATAVAEMGLRSFTQHLEGALIDWALAHASSHEQAAALLGLNRTTFVEKLRRLRPGALDHASGGAASRRRKRVTWEPSFALGADPSDEEHRRIMTLLDEMGFAVLQRDRGAGRLHREVVDLIEVHREHEEAPLEAAGYPGLEAHRVEHAWLGTKLRTLPLEAGAHHELVLLADCIRRHMLVADRQAAAWLATRSA